MTFKTFKSSFLSFLLFPFLCLQGDRDQSHSHSGLLLLVVSTSSLLSLLVSRLVLLPWLRHFQITFFREMEACETKGKIG